MEEKERQTFSCNNVCAVRAVNVEGMTLLTLLLEIP